MGRVTLERLGTFADQLFSTGDVKVNGQKWRRLYLVHKDKQTMIDGILVKKHPPQVDVTLLAVNYIKYSN
jgi:hypothetical protein